MVLSWYPSRYCIPVRWFFGFQQFVFNTNIRYSENHKSLEPLFFAKLNKILISAVKAISAVKVLASKNQRPKATKRTRVLCFVRDYNPEQATYVDRNIDQIYTIQLASLIPFRIPLDAKLTSASNSNPRIAFPMDPGLNPKVQVNRTWAIYFCSRSFCFPIFQRARQELSNRVCTSAKSLPQKFQCTNACGFCQGVTVKSSVRYVHWRGLNYKWNVVLMQRFFLWCSLFLFPLPRVKTQRGAVYQIFHRCKLTLPKIKCSIAYVCGFCTFTKAGFQFRFEPTARCALEVYKGSNPEAQLPQRMAVLLP